MTTLPSELAVIVDRHSGQPLALQISAQLQAAVAVGMLHAGDRLPSSRDLAATLGVSRTVVTNSYARLFAEGWLEGRHGSGTYVADVTQLPPSPLSGSPLSGLIAQSPASIGAQSAIDPDARDGGSGDTNGRLGNSKTHNERPMVTPGTPVASSGRAAGAEVIDLQPGISWAEGVEPAMWRRAWRYAGTCLPSRWPDPFGLPELRAEVTAYLRRSRGLAVTPEQVLITQGISNGFALAAEAVLSPGDPAGVEEPGYATARGVLHRVGAKLVPCRVDPHGIVPEELPDLKLLYITPAHQYPLGGRLPVSRRQALVAWARKTGALVIEDDYDSEFRYDVGPLPALYSMDPDVIVYLGTASKVLGTALGTGWLVAAPSLVEQLAAVRPRLGSRIPESVQHATLELLRSGDLERHVRKMRLEYARRRSALVDGLAGARVPFRLLGDTAGMHIVLELPEEYPAANFIAAAASRGVTIYPLDRYYEGPPTLNGVIIGYGTATLSQVRRAATELATLLSSVPCQTPPARGLPPYE
jgi:GntR family transcriptional regulator / MocR family aminotransferase